MWLVYQKELLELLRDRKTLFFVIALPLLVFPVLFSSMALLMTKAQVSEAQKVHRYAIVGEQYAPQFAKKLFYHKSFKHVSLANVDASNVEALVKSGQIDVAVVINEDYQQNLANHQNSRWQVIFNDAVLTNRIFSRIVDLVSQHNQQLRRDKLVALGVEKNAIGGFLKPVSIEKIDTAKKRENLGEKLGGIIPYILIPLCLVGAVYPAIDMGAGEKERGTLETLLLTPVPRTVLVLGKFLTILTTSIMSALLTVFSMGLWISIFSLVIGSSVIKTAFGTIGGVDLLLILLLLLPLAAIFSSVLLAISIYARSFKEAQNYIAPINMVIFIPIVGALVPGVTLNWVTVFVPVMNVAIAIKEIIKGTVDYGMLWGIFATMSCLAAVVIAMSVYWFNQEKVLFR